ncbi:hypothetical protein PFLUV_G00229120 [Perca fluviatilis]|uniref:Uncharacterized protein n=1 Tax=Perca fluviatilis TaxID=8168 RepID=A0A6A5DQK1_PERFL|nr:hypothetical protein PFLUV_G00229120 [Perca fluviatilis]
MCFTSAASQMCPRTTASRYSVGWKKHKFGLGSDPRLVWYSARARRRRTQRNACCLINRGTNQQSSARVTIRDSFVKTRGLEFGQRRPGERGLSLVGEQQQEQPSEAQQRGQAEGLDSTVRQARRGKSGVSLVAPQSVVLVCLEENGHVSRLVIHLFWNEGQLAPVTHLARVWLDGRTCCRRALPGGTRGCVRLPKTAEAKDRQ